MILERGRVVAEKGHQVWVQTIRQSACESCSARQGCGQRALASVTSGRANQILVDNHLNAQVGDEVTVAIAESALLQASLWVYAVPLSALLAGAILGHRLAPGSDGLAILLASLGLGLGFLLVNRHQRCAGPNFRPQLQCIENSF
ncbi:SoxR reducing system RseC family protein [Marinobacter changyiensis]|uniref:SoxR reducing system RseC family protein n=1 Tax=Marinobacter changyiensis TaxID=2604091 RepID=UPI0012642B31|nr:SoxR reducing system RseC family protein [Marinobacter changyiensis]